MGWGTRMGHSKAIEAGHRGPFELLALEPHRDHLTRDLFCLWRLHGFDLLATHARRQRRGTSLTPLGAAFFFATFFFFSDQASAPHPLSWVAVLNPYCYRTMWKLWAESSWQKSRLFSNIETWSVPKDSSNSIQRLHCYTISKSRRTCRRWQQQLVNSGG